MPSKHLLPRLVLFFGLLIALNFRIVGLVTDTHLVGNQFNTALAGVYFSNPFSSMSSPFTLRCLVFYVSWEIRYFFYSPLLILCLSYLMVEMPSNWILKRMGANVRIRFLFHLIVYWMTPAALASHNCVVRLAQYSFPVLCWKRYTSLWGTVTTLTGLVHNFGGVLGIRLVLGACEGGLLPGMVRLLLDSASRSAT